jgi:hypothetical protein
MGEILIQGWRTSLVNLADLIFECCRQSARSWPKGIAEILELLIWATDDNGAEIMRAVERWLQSDDLDRVRVAVEVEGVFPFHHRAEMDAVLALVKTRWPDLTERCDALAVTRNALIRESEPPPQDVAARVQRLQELLRQALA